MKRNTCLIIISYCLLLSCLAQNSLANFDLTNDDQLTVDTWHGTGNLYDRSQVWIVQDGSAVNLYAYDNSKVFLAGGQIGNKLGAYNNSTIEVSEGSIGLLHADHNCQVTVTGGEINGLQAEDSSNILFSGGKLEGLFDVYDWSQVTFSMKIFMLDAGLSLGENNKLLGSGRLIGEGFDGIRWSIYIDEYHADTASIYLIPEPATLLLFGFGAFILRRRT